MIQRFKLWLVLRVLFPKTSLMIGWDINLNGIAATSKTGSVVIRDVHVHGPHSGILVRGT